MSRRFRPVIIRSVEMNGTIERRASPNDIRTDVCLNGDSPHVTIQLRNVLRFPCPLTLFGRPPGRGLGTMCLSVCRL